MIRAVAFVLAGAVPAVAAPAAAAPVVWDCGLTRAPAGGAIAAPITLTIDAKAGRAQVADPLARFYAGGPVAATLAAVGKGWRLSWALQHVSGGGQTPVTLRYRADLGADGALVVTAQAQASGAAQIATGRCWARGQ